MVVKSSGIYHLAPQSYFPVKYTCNRW